MREGLLWYDNEDKKELPEKISTAVKFFQSKYGSTPRTCFVHPEELKEEIVIGDNIKVLPNERMIKSHIWLEFPEE